jgi:hypothetical protein
MFYQKKYKLHTFSMFNVMGMSIDDVLKKSAIEILDISNLSMNVHY